MSQVLLRLRNISKRFGSVLANDNLSLEILKGEMHALLGENGAGKTTLLNIIDGIYQPDSGDIFLESNRVPIRSPVEAISRGIYMVHQNFSLIRSFTVAENILLMPRFSGPILFSSRKAEDVVNSISKRLGLQVGPQARVSDLPTAIQQRVEIIKALASEARLLLLDEPTSLLTDGEAQQLFTTLRRMVDQGVSVLFTTHKLNEVFMGSDRLTVLRQGRVVSTVSAESTDKRGLARMMVGTEVEFETSRRQTQAGPTVLRVEGLTTVQRGIRIGLDDVSLDIHAGEVLGVAGAAGSGQSELADAITNPRGAGEGRIILLGEDVTRLGAEEISSRGVRHVPDEGFLRSLNPEFSLAENLIMRLYRTRPYSDGFLLRGDEIEGYADRLIEEFDISPTDRDLRTRLLSGGNLQKLILARELSGDIRLLIAFNPTKGLDIKMTKLIHCRMSKIADRGGAVLLISEDLNEILELSDRIAVMSGGRMVGTLETSTADIQTISLMIGGQQVGSY